jgi:hypothetical protein
VSKVPSTLWTDEELASAVDTYVFLLQARHMGLSIDRATVIEGLLGGPLADRNDASVRYRMRNISAVVVELGGQALPEYGPAEQVGKNVRDRIRNLLRSRPAFARLLGTDLSAVKAERDEVVAKLDALHELVDSLEAQIVGIGHNRPPEPIERTAITQRDFSEARRVIDAIRSEVVSDHPNAGQLEAESNRLLRFGASAARWFGERATKFTDTTLTLLAPVAVAKATGLFPAIIDALQTALHFLHP